MSDIPLSELAHTSGVSRHTIRSYIARQLLPGPRSRGRNARYGPEHLERLQAIRVLREERGLGLDAIRLLLATLNESEIRAVASGQPADLPASGHSTGPNADSALAYLEALAAGTEPPALSAAAPWPPVSSPTPAPADALVRRLRGGNEARPVPREARAEAWARINITPDVELLVRGSQDEAQVRQLERLADYLRHLLRGGRHEETSTEQQADE